MALDKDDIKQLIAILQKGLSDEPDNTTDSPTTKKEKPRKQQQKQIISLLRWDLIDYTKTT